MKTLSNLTFSDRKVWAINHKRKCEIIGFLICASIVMLEVVLFVRAIN